MGRVSTRLEDELEERVAVAAAAERLDKSTWIARACVLALEGGARDPEAEALRARVAYLEEKLGDYREQLEDYRSVVEEVRLVRSRQEDIARATGATFEEVLAGLERLRSDALPLAVPAALEQRSAAEPQQAPLPAAGGPVRRLLGRFLG